jgi:hypothetical protein
MRRLGLEVRRLSGLTALPRSDMLGRFFLTTVP